MPIRTIGENPTLHEVVDHWTLLYYSVRLNLWTFYNPIEPRVERDPQMIAAKRLVNEWSCDK